MGDLNHVYTSNADNWQEMLEPFGVLEKFGYIHYNLKSLSPVNFIHF